MMFRAKTKEEFRTGRWIPQACLALILFNAAGLLAGYHWFFDLFVNFKLPFLLASLLLAALALCFKKRLWSLAMLCLGATILIEIQLAYSAPFAKPPAMAPNLTVVQYNKYYYNDSFEEIGTWLHKDGHDFDIVIINESSPQSLRPVREKTSDIFPHQYPTSFYDRFNDIAVLGKWPFTVEPVRMRKDGATYSVSRIVVSKEGLPPVTIYAYHTQTPVGPNDAALRNFELDALAGIVQNDPQSHKLMVGDWNVTPWSPHFRNILARTGLNYQNYGLLPQATFPAYARFSLLQMPIDHILFDRHFDLVSIGKGPAMDSDHHSLIAGFHVKTID